jgi:DNA-binding winged helix-turn-helix (wHTH) protein/TolB-like protein
LSPNTTCQFGEFEIQPDFNTITHGDTTVSLSPRVMDVLMHLIKNNDRVVPANELLETFWADRIVEESTIHRHISQIRTALGDSAKEAKYIKTVSKRGYQAVALVTVVASEPVKTQSQTPSEPQTQPPPQLESEQNNTDSQYTFISYSHKDKQVVVKEIEWLEDQGVKVWFDKGISPGSNWLSAIGDSLLGASSVLFFVSKNSLASDHCNREISLALDEGITIIPIYLDNSELTSDLKVGLSRVQALRIKEQGFRTQLLQTLAFAQGPKTQTPAPVAAKPERKSGRLIAAAVGALALIGVSLVSVNLFTDDAPSNAGLTEDGEVVESIAVLPFASLSERQSVGFFAEGLSDSILDELVQIGHVKVAPRTAVTQLSEQDLELEELAKRLEVDYVLEGTVQEQDGDLRISTQLVRANDGSHIFSNTYESLFKNSFTAQREISRNISQISHDKIWLDLRELFPDRFGEFNGIEPEAVKLYLESVDQYNEFVLGEGGNLNIAMQLMEKAAEIDPNFFLAHSELAWNYLQRINQSLSLEESSRRAHAAVERMQALAPDSSDSSFMLVQIYIRLDLDYDSAQRLIEQEIAKAPRLHWWRTFQANIAVREGRGDEAISLIKADATLHPDFTESQFLPLYAAALVISARYSESIQISDQALALLHKGPARSTVLLTKARALLHLKRHEEAVPLLREAWNSANGEIPEQFAQLFALTGDPERAREILQSATVKSGNRLFFAVGYDSLGDIETTLDLIHDGVVEHDHSIIYLMRADVFSEEVRRHPRFSELLALLESKVTHTARYLRDHDGQGVKSI